MAANEPETRKTVNGHQIRKMLQTEFVDMKVTLATVRQK